MITHLTDDELVLYYYGEMENADDQRAESHLSSCGTCQQNYARLQRVMAFVDSAPAVDAPPGFERTAWARLQPALPAPRSRWLFGFQPSFGRLAWAGALVVVIAASFLAGRLLPSRSAVVGTTPTGVTTPASANAEQVRERIL